MDPNKTQVSEYQPLTAQPYVGQPVMQQPMPNPYGGQQVPQYHQQAYMPPQPSIQQQVPGQYPHQYGYPSQPQGIVDTHQVQVSLEYKQVPPPMPPPPHHPNHHYDNRLIYTESHVPMIMRCYHCGYDGLTKASVNDGAAVWVTCVVCCLLGCWLCAPCTFCMDGLKDVHHYCGSCNALLAVKKPCH